MQASRRLLAAATVYWLFVSMAAAGSDDYAVNYQLHSYNDLREWRPLWSKAMAVTGVSPWLKVDAYFVANETYCLEQDGVAGACFLLTHDAPSPGSPRRYNTTDQLLAWLGAEHNSAFFRALPPDALPPTVALCFKLAGVAACGNDTLSVAWRRLVTDLFDKATALQQAVPWLRGRLQFVLDGAAAPGAADTACLNQLWRPWNATYIWTLSPSSQPLAAAFSDDAAAAYDRLLVLNEPEYHSASVNRTEQVDAAPDYLHFFQDLRYAKFAAQPAYPLLFWEPSDQATIEQVVAVYRRPDAPASPPPQGLRFAINIDPAQFQVFSGARGLNQRTAPVTAPSTRTAAASLAAAAAAVTFYNDALQLDVNYVVVQPRTANGSVVAPLPLLGQGRLPAAGLLAAPVAAASPLLPLSPTVATVVLSDRLGNVCLLDYLPPASFAVAAAGLSLPAPATAALPLRYSTTAASTTSDRLLFQAALDSHGAVHLSVFRLLPAWSLSPPLASATTSAPSAYTTLSLSLLPVSASTFVGLIVAGSNASSSSAVVAVRVDVDQQACNASLTSLACALPGQDPSVAVQLDPCSQQPAFVVTTAEAFCFNSEVHNKQASVAVCDLRPTATPRVLNYYFGPLSSLPSLSGVLTPCSASVVSGSYDQGNAPSVLLLQSKPALLSPFTPCLSVLASHQTAFDAPAPQSTQSCGLANPANDNAIVFDSWVLAYSIDAV